MHHSKMPYYSYFVDPTTGPRVNPATTPCITETEPVSQTVSQTSMPEGDITPTIVNTSKGLEAVIGIMACVIIILILTLIGVILGWMRSCYRWAGKSQR